MISSDIIYFWQIKIANVKVFVTILFFVAGLAVKGVYAQEITQNVRGKIIDLQRGSPLAGANIKAINASSKEFTATSDDRGNFVIQCPVGRYQLWVSFTGYQTFSDELLVVAGKESVITISLKQSETVLEAVEIGSASVNTELPGLQQVSIEKTLRVPANFFDPVRMITSYPGVVAANDQNNSIIVRGNSPNGLLWRLNGLDIVNPNHLSNAGTFSDRPAANGGGVNILSAQMLDRTDFYMGTIPANYGNTLAGVVDMELREGNKSDYEYTAQASLIGLDFSAEGPLGKQDKNSFLANYRYSTVGLLSAAGINFGDESISFQDISFNTNFQQNNGGEISFFGFGGYSKNNFNGKEESEWEEDKDKYEIDYEALTFAIGSTYSVPISRGKLSAGVAYSVSDQERVAQSVFALPLTQPTLRQDDLEATNEIISGSLKYGMQLDKGKALEFGMLVNYMPTSFYVYRLFACGVCGEDEYGIDGSATGTLWQPYAAFNFSMSKSVELTTGIRYLNYSFNNTQSIEPRLSLTLRPTEVASFTAAYSLISQLQLPQVYFAAGNENLGFTRSHHVDLDYRQTVGNGLILKTGVFYQYLFDVPIEQDPSSTFSVINLMEALSPEDLVNEGTGENYGIDLTVEKYFYGKNYMLVGGSYYDSKYTGADGIKRDTRFNGNYTLNAVYGKEWTKTSKNRTIGLNTRLLYLGGLRESDINVAQSLNNGETVYDSTNPFNNKLPDYFRLDVRLSFRKNKPGYTRTFAIDIQNLTSQQNESLHYYDLHQGKIVTKYQLGIIPVLVYRIDF